jgi:hypothetical protein
VIWVAWRQHRAQIVGGLAVLVVVGGFLLLTGLHLHDQFNRLGLDQCAAPVSDTCPSAANQFRTQYHGYQFLIPLFLVLPALIGILWGAPLVSREIEAGTHRLAWTQSVSRRRWLLVKVAMLAGAVLVGFAVVTTTLNWWTGPLMATDPQRFDFGIFDLLGLVPVAYALAALALGIAAGALVGRLLPALGLTLVVFVGLRVGVEFALRPNFMAPITTSFAFPLGNDKSASAESAASAEPQGWLLSEQTVDAAGRVISDGVGFEPAAAALNDCPELAPSAHGPFLDRPAASQELQACAQRAGFHVVATYQPEDRYWRFQITEAAIFVAIAIGSVAGTSWYLRRKVG